MTFVEHEVKFILTKQRFREVMDLASGLLPDATRKSVVQINHYYDTPDLKLHNQGITCRIRQKGEQLQGQLKRHNFGKSSDSREETFYVESLPPDLTAEGEQVSYLGQLVTHRESLICTGYRLDFDTSYYWGQCDYELEIEYEESALHEVQALAATLGLGAPGRMPGKFSRFLMSREKSKFFFKTR